MKIHKVKDVKTPTRGTPGSAGLDFYIPNDFYTNDLAGRFFIQPGKSVNIPSGIHVKIPKGYALIAMNKSGVALKKSLQVGACVVDEDYQGEIHLHVVNTGSKLALIKPGEKLVQFLLIPVKYEGVEVVESLEELFPEESERGEGGFGSTNKK